MSNIDRLATLIAAVRRRWFLTVLLRTGGTAMAAAGAVLLAGLIAYWLIDPTGLPLIALASTATLVSIVAAVLVARRVEPRPDDARVGRFIEERAGLLPGAAPMDDAVVSAVQASTLPASDPRAPFAALVVGAAVRRLDGVDASAVVPSAAVRRAALAGGAGALLLGTVLVAGWPVLLQTYETARLRLFPASISFEVLPGDARVVAGRPLTIRARVHAGGQVLARGAVTLAVRAGGDERVVAMNAAGDAFEFGFESVDRSFHYRVVAGAARSAEHSVTALFPPRVTRIDVHYEYPAFTKLAARTEVDGGDVYGPAGTRVRLKIHTDKPVLSGQLAMSKSAPSLRAGGEQVMEAELIVARDDSYRIGLTDGDGLVSADDSEYFIRVMEDRPPDVRILRPSGDQGITPLQEVPIEARAEDDYGIASLALVYSVGGGKEHVVPFANLAGGETQRTGAHLLAAEELKVRPGDVITYYAVARDVARGRRSTESKSDIFFLEVHPFNEEFVSAQSQAGAAGGDPQLESLIQAQKDIISATWNIERRAASGRSEEDIKAIARAQADLKARVDRLLEQSRTRRGRGFIAQRVIDEAPQAPGGNPVASAAEAMVRAIEQLASDKTREAIPHEMAALNGLLQAQAEVRRRQIAQQSRGGGGGFGNRQSQDLSALFDKELQRQQRTNYEQRSQVEERPNNATADQELADRIRDLARRQEALNREQREAAKAQAEERKRQLERLAREQEQLQREAEAIRKQMEQRGENGAAQQMGSAANDMRSGEGQSGARNGERVAEQLRQLEGKMRGGGADARQRAAADLQAEAQQVAQEQRRIAAEAERMEKTGETGNADARRRLAADKDRLSDRVQGLQQQADRLGREKENSAETARAREAAAALERQQVAERMRQSAEQMRDGTKGASAQVEQQLAKALDQVVGTLGGTDSADARTLAEQLDQSREIRERLDRLEGEMRAAEGRKDGQFDKLRQQYEQELGKARQSLGSQPGGERPGGEARGGNGRSTPEEQQFSRSAPGTEAFKQDRSRWESLRKDLDRALEEHDAEVSRRLAKSLGEGGLNAGGSDRVPEQYRRLIAKYYESLAKVKK